MITTPHAMLITGTTRGIGRFLAERYLREGWRVGGCGRGAAAIEHPSYTHYTLDITREGDVVAMVRDFSRACGRLDALINNAGIAVMNHVLTTPGSMAERLMATNFLASFYALREAGKVMSRARTGRIVSLSTIAVPLHLEGEAIYAASKAALETLTRVAAHELGSFGITVNAVGPAPIMTDLIKALPRHKLDRLLERQAIKRLATFDDVAAVIDFFLDERSGFVTGQRIYLGGASA